ncbi:MAG: polysaccharide lyase, partial [Pseudobdellovibrionaceae bacterium]
MKRQILGLLTTFLFTGLAQAQLAPLPVGNTGLASKYSNDVGIGADPNVIFSDDFESYTGTSQLTTKWSSYYQSSNTRIATEAGNFFGGAKALEMTLPQVSQEVSNAVVKNLSTTQDVLFVRIYTKFDPGYDVNVSSNHNGIRISAKYPGPGRIPSGSDFFLYLMENAIDYGEADPGYTRLYTYHPEQRSQWGDIFYPNGKVLPIDGVPGDFGPYFVSRPNFIPQRGRWYSYELMVKANTPGQRDGRAAMWIDGNLVADFPNLRMRDISTLKIDQIQLELHSQSGGSLNRQNKKYYDNVVVAKSYIGPVQSGTPPPPPPPPSLAAPTNLRVVSVAYNQVKLQFDDSNSTESGFQVHRKIGSS